MAGLVATLVSGGPIVGLLIVLSLFSLALIGAKVIELRGVLSGGRARAAALARWAEGERPAAAQMLAAGRAPADRIARAAMEGLIAGRRRPVVEADLEWRGNAEVSAMSRHIRLLELIAMISPLLGLLGTVLGMIRAFKELAAAEGAANASVLAAGIWEALLTTAAGLIVAIPAMVAATMLSARIDRAAQAMEAAAGEIFALEEDRG